MRILDFFEKSTRNGIKENQSITEDIANNIYIKEIALYIASSYISNTLAKCEIKVFERNKEVKNELYYKLNVSPNTNESSTEFFSKLINNLLFKGESVVVLHRNQFYNADSWNYEQKVFTDDIYDGFLIGNQQLNKKIKSSDLFHFKMTDRAPKFFVDSLYNEYNKLIAQSLNSYKVANSNKYKLMIDNYQSGDREFQENIKDMIENDLKKFIQSDIGVLPLYRGTDLQKVDSTSASNQNTVNDVLNLRREIFEIIAQTFKIPLDLLMNDKTDNINELINLYLTICIEPIADMIGEELTRKTSDFNSWSNGNYIRVDTSCITHMDILQVSTAVDKLVASGVCNIDEIRTRLNFNTLNTDFSTQYYMTKNYSKIDDIITGTNQEKENSIDNVDMLEKEDAN